MLCFIHFRKGGYKLFLFAFDVCFIPYYTYGVTNVKNLRYGKISLFSLQG